MPCDSPYSYTSTEVEKLVYENKLTTRFSCECLTKLEQENLPIPDYIKPWWEEHKAWDKRRLEMEQKYQDEIDKEKKKWQQISNALENGVETLFSDIIPNEIDCLKEKCKKCNRGTYQEMSMHDDLEGKVTCNKCNNRVDRYIISQ